MNAAPSPGSAADARSVLNWGPRLTIRTRLTLTYAALVTGCGAILITVVWAFMRYVPTYAIAAAGRARPSSDDLAGHARLATPQPTLGGDSIAITRAPAIKVTSAADFLNILLITSIATLVLLAIISGLVGWIVAGRVLRPLKAINKAATIAATGSLDHRVGLQGPHDEIRDLSDTFDRMLGALDRSFDAHRRFASNASHELRTPLATTQTMIDVTLADPDADTATLRELARRIHEVNRSNMQTVESLLDLATIGHGHLTREPVDLRSVIADTVGSLSPETRERDLTLTVHKADSDELTQPVIAAGNPILLRQAVANLVQNAIRHNVDGGTIDIRVERNEENAAITVTNSGDRVPDDIVESLLEPFVRGTGRTVRHGGRHGHGLGLAIAASIANAHGGSLRLAANPGGGLTTQLILRR